MRDSFRIGNGNITTMEQVTPVYISYASLELPMNEEIFNQEIQDYKIFFESDEITPIRFVPKSAMVQKTSQYYFLKVDVKIPRNA